MSKLTLVTSSLVSFLSVANQASAQFVFEESFESPTIIENGYAASTGGVSTSDGLLVRQSGSDPFGVGFTTLVPDESPFSTGREVRNGFKFDTTAVAFFTLPKSVGVWDSNLDYTISMNVRSFDTADTDGSVAGRFIVASRQDNDSLTFLGKNVALDRSAADGWTTITQTITGAEVAVSGISGQRIYASFSKTSGGSGDFMLLDNFSIEAVAIPESSTSALVFSSVFGAFALLRRRR